MISVVIPTLNEAERLPALIAALRAQDPGCEVIVVDGGSDDATPDLAAAQGARVLASAPGRGLWFCCSWPSLSTPISAIRR